jgi:hypothetical protein
MTFIRVKFTMKAGVPYSNPRYLFETLNKWYSLPVWRVNRRSICGPARGVWRLGERGGAGNKWQRVWARGGKVVGVSWVPVLPTSTQESESNEVKPRDAIDTTLIDAKRRDAYPDKAKTSLVTPYDTVLANRRRASRRPNKHSLT